MEIIEKIQNVLKNESSIALAYVFGSYARGQAISESDCDVAVYFKTADGSLEREETTVYPLEDKIWLELERATSKNIDLIVLNRVPSLLVYKILNEGIPVIDGDARVRSGLISNAGFDALDFLATADDWRLISARSSSLNEIDRNRLLRLIDFLEQELADGGHFTGITWQIYQTDSDKRRNCERWVENIVNCSIDIAKIILASEKRLLPETYKEILRMLSIMPGISEDTTLRLAAFAKLRNILAHEYLDVRFEQIQRFLAQAQELYATLIVFGRDFLKK